MSRTISGYLAKNVPVTSETAGIVVRIYEFGDPEVMKIEETQFSLPGSGQARVRIEAAGINFIDTYQRRGLYPVNLPHSMGQEGAGVVEEIGDGVAEVKIGDRVVWVGAPGSYATHVTVEAARLVRMPAGITFQQAAAAMLQGMTAHYLSHSTYPLAAGDTCLIHAAAGGVGLLLCQMAKMRGARVIGTVSTEEKAKLAREAGVDEIVFYTKSDFETEVKRITGGNGVQVVYDGVGKETFEKSLRCLAPRGMLVLFGQSSGPVPQFDPQILSKGGSLFLTRPTLAHYTASRQDLMKRAGDILNWVGSGKLKLRIDRTFPLTEAVEAHKALEGRRTSGKILLIPR